MNDMKSAFAEALSKRKKKSAGIYANDEETRKRQDLAPDVKDTPEAKLEIEISMKPEMEMEDDGMDSGMDDGMEGAGINEMAKPKEANLATLMGKEPTEFEMEGIRNNKPKSLLDAAKKALMFKKG
jgi:hypothetical protein